MTVEVDKLNKEGQAEGKVQLPEEVFGVEPNVHVMHLASKRELANARSGSANSKTRSEVRGGGRKPWRQKGTGRARAGSIRSPLWRGGGVIFGPKPRDFSFKMPRKMRRLALRSALSVAAKEGKLKAVEDFGFIDKPSTKLFTSFLEKSGLAGTRILILSGANENLSKAVSNIPLKKIRLPLDLSVRDLVQADVVLATQDALATIGERFKANAK